MATAVIAAPRIGDLQGCRCPSRDELHSNVVNGGPGAVRSRCRHCAGRTPRAVGGWTTIEQSLASVAADNLRRLTGDARASAPMLRRANGSPASADEKARGLEPEVMGRACSSVQVSPPRYSQSLEKNRSRSSCPRTEG